MRKGASIGFLGRGDSSLGTNRGSCGGVIVALSCVAEVPLVSDGETISDALSTSIPFVSTSKCTAGDGEGGGRGEMVSRRYARSSGET